MLKNRRCLIMSGIMVLAIGLAGCSSKDVSSVPETSTVASTSEEDLDALVAKKVQEQLEIDRRVKESVESAKAQETEATTEAATTEAPTTAAVAATYLLPFSNERLVTNDDLAKLSKDQLRLARNEIYARHGRIYETNDLNQYFRSQSWYQPSVTSDQWNDSMFSSIESQNVQRIANYEKNGSVEAQKMKLKSGVYTYNPKGSDGNTVDASYYIEMEDAGEIDIYFSFEESYAQGMATTYSGYFTYSTNDKYNPDNIYTAIRTYDGYDGEVSVATLQMTSNGFKDLNTGRVYVYEGPL